MFGSFGITESSDFTAKGIPFRVPTASLRPGLLEKMRKEFQSRKNRGNLFFY